MGQPERYDAIVVGSGHNGLIAAGYLAQSGKHVLVLERRDIIGGAAVTEDTFPGYRLSTCSYVCNLLLPEVVDDLQLVKYGYHVRPFEPTYFVPFPDGDYFMTFLDGDRTREQIARHSKKDADAYGHYWAMWDRILDRMQPLIRRPAPTEAEIAAAFAGPDGKEDWKILTETSIGDLLDRYFESDKVKAPYATGGVIGVNAGPRDPGTAYVKFHHLIGSIDGHQGAWGFVRGGMGSITQALAHACRDRGVEILTSAEVEEIELEWRRDRRSFVRWATLCCANRRLECRSPSHLPRHGGRLHLPADLVAGIEQMRVKGSVVKLLVGMGELPDFTAMPGKEVGVQHTGGIVINPSIDYLQAAWEDCQRGNPSRLPFMDIYIQTATEDGTGLAPSGKHTLSAFVQYAPYDLAEGTWDERRAEIGQTIVDTIAAYAPNFRARSSTCRCWDHPTSNGSSVSRAGISSMARSCRTRCSATGRSWIRRLSDANRRTLSLWQRGVAGRRVFGAPGRNAALRILGAFGDPAVRA
ncbi:MAG: NAD(P)/FAD-dependent oxidoreductase [Thermomicrobiales bacterium]